MKPHKSSEKQASTAPHEQRACRRRQPVAVGVGDIKTIEMRGLLVLAMVAAAACLVSVRGADGAGECGATPPDRMALKLAPCASAAQNPSSAPSSSCCNAVHSIGKQSPKCLCAVMLSKTAKSAGIKPEVAITIPKRCNLVDRPIGYKCGDYTLP